MLTFKRRRVEKTLQTIVNHKPPPFISGSGGGLGTGGLALAYQCQQSGQVRACVESVLVLSLMNKLRPLLEAEQLLSPFTKVPCSMLYSSFANKY